MHLDRCQVVVEDVRSGKGRAGDKASELVFFPCANQLYVYALAKVFHRLSKDAVVHELVEVLLEVAGSPFSELCVHPDVELHPGALPEAEGPVNLLETHAQRKVELQDTVVKHVTGLVAEVRYQLLNLSWRHPSAKEIVLILRHPRILDNHVPRVDPPGIQDPPRGWMSPSGLSAG